MVLLEANWLTEQSRSFDLTGLLLSMRLPYAQRQLTENKTTPGFSPSKDNSNERDIPLPIPFKMG
jgi:hypothetical protein